MTRDCDRIASRRKMVLPLEVALIFVAVPSLCPALPDEAVRVQRSGFRFRLHAVDADLPDIASKLGAHTGVRIAIDPEFQDKRLTISLSPRPAERIVWSIARRLKGRADIAYTFRRRASSDSSTGPWAFATESVTLEIDKPVPLEDALRGLGVAVRLESALDRDVRVFSPGLPLYRILDSLASQTDSVWTVEVRLGPRITDDTESVQATFSDLAKFPPPERREEIEWDVHDALTLPRDRSEKAIERIANAIRSMPTLFQRIPDDHRGPLESKFAGVLKDYRAVIEGKSAPERSRLTLLASAINTAEIGFRTPR